MNVKDSNGAVLAVGDHDRVPARGRVRAREVGAGVDDRAGGHFAGRIDRRPADSVQVIKDLKVKGSSQTLKRGSIFKSIRVDEDNPEEVECKDGRSTLVLKTCFIKKV